ncbi:glycosyltransferase family 61 protein [Pseudomonas sp. BNK-45]|uniref:glycosyltransferase family 61 protein n=1 Tax=Pseudomonas sp. BNK-45 TaxID=3376180 RepID=UPI0039BFCE21
MKLKKTLISIYRRNLAKYFILRFLKEILIVIYRLTHRLKSLSKNIEQSGEYSLISLSSFSSSSSANKILITPEKRLHIPAPNFSGYFSDRATKSNGRIEIETPRLEIFEISNAMIVGRLDIIFKDRIAVHHNLFDATTHQTPSENVGVTSIDRQKNSINLYLTAQPNSIKEAFSMIGQCSGNYAHWLTETLPKLAMLDACGEYKDIPIIVDENLHQNMYASLELINVNRREIIKIRAWCPLHVEKLILASQPGYERYSPHNLNSKEPPHYINRFSPEALCMLKDSIKSSLEPRFSQKNETIYLARSQKSGNIRHIENITEVESLIAASGIIKIVSDSMSFRDQVTACINAKIIIAPIGASLANMIFCPPGCKLIVLSPYYQDASYFYYTNLSGVLGHELYYVLGQQKNQELHPAHRNYYIDTKQLTETLEEARSREY